MPVLLVLLVWLPPTEPLLLLLEKEATFDWFPALLLLIPLFSTGWMLSDSRAEIAFDRSPAALAVSAAWSDATGATMRAAGTACDDLLVDEGEAVTGWTDAAERSLIGGAALTGVADGAIHEGGS